MIFYILAILAIILANLPLGWLMIRHNFDLGTLYILMGHSPNQFLFNLFIVTIAAYLVGLAGRRMKNFCQAEVPGQWIWERAFRRGRLVPLFTGLIFASVFSVLTTTGEDPDVYEVDRASAEIAAEKLELIVTSWKTSEVARDTTAVMDAQEWLRDNIKSQNADGVMLVLNGVELGANLFIFWHILFWVVLAARLRRTVFRLAAPAPLNLAMAHLTASAGLYALWIPLDKFNLEETNRLGLSIFKTPGDVFGLLIVIVVAILVIIYYFPTKFPKAINSLLPIGLAIGSWILTKFDVVHFDDFLGPGAPWVNLVILLFIYLMTVFIWLVMQNPESAPTGKTRSRKA